MPSLPDPLARLILPFRADESANRTLAIVAVVGVPLLAAPRAVIRLNKRTELVGFRNTR